MMTFRNNHWQFNPLLHSLQIHWRLGFWFMFLCCSPGFHVLLDPSLLTVSCFFAAPMRSKEVCLVPSQQGAGRRVCCYFKRERDIKCLRETENEILFLWCINSMNFLISMGRKRMVEINSKWQCSFLHCSCRNWWDWNPVTKTLHIIFAVKKLV